MISVWQPGQLLFVGFPGREVTRALADLINQGRVGGVILFPRNLHQPRQIKTLIRDLHGLAPPEAPLIVAIDQEGGRVQRLRAPWTEWPPMRALGARADDSDTADVAAAIGTELCELGVHVNFAPVVDVDDHRADSIIGDRSFHADARIVGQKAAVFVKAMQAQGVAACAKHFPGHGRTEADSHTTLPRIDCTLEHLRACDLVPFRRAIDAGVASVMAAHVVFPCLDGKRPASLSPDVLNLLREELGYDRLVFTDDLEMAAVAHDQSVRHRTLMPLEAGADALIIGRHLDLAQEMLPYLERAPDRLVESALSRMVAFKRKFAKKLPASRGKDPARADERPPYPRHQALAARLHRG